MATVPTFPRWLLATTVALSVALPAQGGDALSDIGMALKVLSRQLRDVDISVKFLGAEMKELQRECKTQSNKIQAELEEKLNSKFEALMQAQQYQHDSMKTSVEESLFEKLNSTIENTQNRYVIRLNNVKSSLEKVLGERLNSTLQTINQEHSFELNNTKTALQKGFNSTLEFMQHGLASHLEGVKTALEVTLDETLSAFKALQKDTKRELDDSKTAQRAVVGRILNVTNSSETVYVLAATVPDFFQNERWRQILFRAAQDGRCHVVAGLLTSAASNETHSLSDTALDLAYGRNHVECVRLLLERGARLRGAVWEDALANATKAFRLQELTALLAAGTNPDARDKSGSPVLVVAADSGCSLCVKELLRRGADLNIRIASRRNGTALMAASMAGHLGAVEALLAAGADVDAVDRDGDTALHYGARFGRTGVARVLLQAGADVDARGYERRTALHLAATKGHEGTARLLLESGADASGTDGFGKTALDYASGDGIRRLLEGSGR